MMPAPSVPVVVGQAVPVTSMSVTVPNGVRPGEAFEFQATDGSMYQVACPEQGYPGMVMQVQVAPAVPVVDPVHGVPVQGVPTKNQIIGSCRGCGRDFLRDESKRGSCQYYRCKNCDGWKSLSFF